MKSLQDYINENKPYTGSPNDVIWHKEEEVSKKELEDILKNIGVPENKIELDKYKDGTYILRFYNHNDNESEAPASAYIKRDGKFYFCSGHD